MGWMMWYVASPYSHPEPAVRDRRFRSTCETVAALLRAGHAAFSPIVHSHPMVEYGLPTDWDFWERFDGLFLERCQAVVVLTLDGWRESIGVQAEIRRATELGKPVRYLAPGDAHGWPTFAPFATSPPT